MNSSALICPACVTFHHSYQLSLVFWLQSHKLQTPLLCYWDGGRVCYVDRERELEAVISSFSAFVFVKSFISVFCVFIFTVMN
jgi:hypothetical protein